MRQRPASRERVSSVGGERRTKKKSRRTKQRQKARSLHFERAFKVSRAIGYSVSEKEEKDRRVYCSNTDAVMIVALSSSLFDTQ